MSQTSVLQNYRPSLALPLVLALIGHVCAGGGLAVGSWITERSNRRIIDPNETMTVSIQLKPKTDKKMVQKATRAPRPQGAPDVKPNDAPPPVKQSDLEIHKPKPEPKAAGTPNQSSARDKLVKQMLMQQLVQDATASEGKVDRDAADPNGEGDVAINSGANSVAGNRERAIYEAKVQAAFKPHFRPLPTVTAANPGISCRVQVQFDLATGRVTDHRVSTPSGNPSYDAACSRAVAAVPRIPPPPESLHTLYANGVGVRFTPPE